MYLKRRFTNIVSRLFFVNYLRSADFLSRLFAQTMHRDWIMLTDSPTGIVNVQPILDAIWLFLLGSCRRLANAASSPSISSGFDPDICSADPLASMHRASMRTFLTIPTTVFCFKMHNSGRIANPKFAYLKKKL